MDRNTQICDLWKAAGEHPGTVSVVVLDVRPDSVLLHIKSPRTRIADKQVKEILVSKNG